MEEIHVLVISRDNLNKIVEYSVHLSSLCNADSRGVPANFCNYPSYCYMGAVWQAVDAETILIFLAIKGDIAVAVATLHRDHMGIAWQEGFEVALSEHDDALTTVKNYRKKYLGNQPKTAIGG